MSRQKGIYQAHVYYIIFAGKLRKIIRKKIMRLKSCYRGYNKILLHIFQQK